MRGRHLADMSGDHLTGVQSAVVSVIGGRWMSGGCSTIVVDHQD